MLAIACPGQGSQTPGFLQPWLELPEVADRLGWFSAVAGIDLVAHGTTSDAETIRDTAIAQPLIVAAGLATAPILFGRSTQRPTPAPATVIAGHSVGELTAAALAGVLSVEQAMVLVRERGAAMARAGAVTPTGMSAVLGGDPDDVSEALTALGLTAANLNGAGQVVAAGTLEQLAALTAKPPAGSRVIPLQVAGAFHTGHMAPAVTVLAGLTRALQTGDPHTTLLSNADGATVADGAQLLSRLVTQVSAPVRWDLCMQTMVALGVTAMIELPPAGALTGLARRAMRGIDLVAVKTPSDLAAAEALIKDHDAQPVLHLNPSGGLG